QSDGNLGQRLAAVFPRGGHQRPTVVLGADTPDLPVAYVRKAFDLLEAGNDTVIGPARDGGYYLIAARRLHPALFEQIPWSTSRVLATTRQRAEAAGIRLRELPPWED